MPAAGRRAIQCNQRTVRAELRPRQFCSSSSSHQARKEAVWEWLFTRVAPNNLHHCITGTGNTLGVLGFIWGIHKYFETKEKEEEKEKTKSALRALEKCSAVARQVSRCC